MLDLVTDERVHTDALPLLSDEIPCEMADPVRCSPDGQSVESFQPCGAAAVWRLVLRWHYMVDNLDEHLLCQRHLEIWQVFRLVENPAWNIALLDRL